MEIYLKYRRIQKVGLSHNLPVQKNINAACNKINQAGKGTKDTFSLMRKRDLAKWKYISRNENLKKGQLEAAKVTACQEWADTWEKSGRRQNSVQRATADPELWSAASFYRDKATGKKRISFRGGCGGSSLRVLITAFLEESRFRSEVTKANSLSRTAEEVVR
jgi:uncharacterized membrane protein YdbT with pleckstrin-like domain